VPAGGPPHATAIQGTLGRLLMRKPQLQLDAEDSVVLLSKGSTAMRHLAHV